MCLGGEGEFIFLLPLKYNYYFNIKNLLIFENDYPKKVTKKMKVDFGNNKLKRQLSSASEIKRAFGLNAKRISQRLSEMQAAPNLAVLQQIPAANCHPLKGKRNGEWAVDVSGNFRLIFVLDHDPIPKDDLGTIVSIKITDVKIVEITDYH